MSENRKSISVDPARIQMEAGLTRRRFLQGVGSFIGTAAVAGRFGLRSANAAEVGSGSSSKDKPNIVFILADDMGWADPGCYGNEFIETPNIDRLASQGIRFTQAYAAAPVCSPTRASIHSGQYPSRFDLYDFLGGPHKFLWPKLKPPENRPMPLETITLAEALKEAGYASCHVGKWHVGNKLEEQGYVSAPQKYGDANALPREFVGELSEFAQSNPEKKTGPITEQAIRFIQANQDVPFLCYISYHAVHIRCEARQELVDKYKAKARASGTVINHVYAAMNEAMDEAIGYVMKALDLLDLTDNTVVIFFSDNGGLDRTVSENAPIITTNSPLRGYKGQLYEGGIRDPLIVRWPGIVKPGAVCHTPVISNDFMPTMLDVAGSMPKQGQVVDGVSIVPLLKGGSALDRDALYWHYPVYHHSTPAAAIRESDYKLIEFFEDGHLELYNLSEDIGEKHNLAEAMPEKAAELRDKLHRWQESVGARFPTPNPNYDPEKANFRTQRGKTHRINWLDPKPQ